MSKKFESIREMQERILKGDDDDLSIYSNDSEDGSRSLGVSKKVSPTRKVQL